jgi:hypothetical protein
MKYENRKTKFWPQADFQPAGRTTCLGMALALPTGPVSSLARGRRVGRGGSPAGRALLAVRVRGDCTEKKQKRNVAPWGFIAEKTGVGSWCYSCERRPVATGHWCGAHRTVLSLILIEFSNSFNFAMVQNTYS